MKTITNNLLSNPVFSHRVREFVDKAEITPDFIRSKKKFSDLSDLRPEDVITLLNQGKVTEKDAMFWLGVLALNAEERSKKHEQLANVDELTQVYNRRSFIDNFSKELNRLRAKHIQIEKLLEEPMTLSLAMIDIDFFKKVNDTYGHIAGDYVLKGVAEVVAREIRASDGVFRYGGEEFAILLPDTNRETAREIADRIRETIGNTKFAINKRKDKKIKITISMGISAIDGHELAKTTVPDTYISKLINRADEALYLSKKNGRNQVTMWSTKTKQELKLKEEESK